MKIEEQAATWMSMQPEFNEVPFHDLVLVMKRFTEKYKIEKKYSRSHFWTENSRINQEYPSARPLFGGVDDKT